MKRFWNRILFCMMVGLSLFLIKSMQAMAQEKDASPRERIAREIEELRDSAKDLFEEAEALEQAGKKEEAEQHHLQAQARLREAGTLAGRLESGNEGRGRGQRVRKQRQRAEGGKEQARRRQPAGGPRPEVQEYFQKIREVQAEIHELNKQGKLEEAKKLQVKVLKLHQQFQKQAQERAGRRGPQPQQAGRPPQAPNVAQFRELLQRVQELHKQGKHEEAGQLLRESHQQRIATLRRGGPRGVVRAVRPSPPNREQLQDNRRREEVERNDNRRREEAEREEIARREQRERVEHEERERDEPAEREHRENEERKNHEREKLHRRLEHLRVAIDNLHEAEFHEQAEQLQREAQELERHLHGQHEQGQHPGEEVEHLNHQMNELREHIGHLEKQNEKIRAHVEKLTDAVEALIRDRDDDGDK